MNPSALPRKRGGKTIAVFLASFCAVAGFIAFFRTRPDFLSNSASLPRPANPPASQRSAPLTFAPVVPEFSAAPSVPPEVSPKSIRKPDANAPNAPILPPPPSGDYDLTLAPEQIASLVEAKYRELFPALGLPAARLNRLRTLLIERQQTTIDAANAALLFGLNPVRDLPEILRGIERFQSGVDATIREEFGAAIFSTYFEFDHTFRERNSIADFRRLVEADHEPLRPEQEEQLLALLKKFPERVPPSDFPTALYGGVNDRAAISPQALAAASAAVLSPLQSKRWRELQERLSADTGER